MDVRIQQLIASRRQANQEILKHIEEMVNKYPDLRFGQILANLEIIQYECDDLGYHPIPLDPYHEESVVMLRRINKAKNK